MAARILTIVVLLLVVSSSWAQLTTYDLAASGTSRSLTLANGTVLFSGALNFSTPVYSAWNGQISFQTTPTSAFVAAVSSLVNTLNSTADPDASNGTVSFALIHSSNSDRVYRATFASNFPFVTYFGVVQGGVFRCQAATPSTSFTCSVLSGGANFSAVYSTSLLSGAVRANLTAISGATPAQLESPLLSLGFHHLQAQAHLYTTSVIIEDNNSARLDENREYVAALWYIFVSLMTMVLVMISTMNTWICSKGRYCQGCRAFWLNFSFITVLLLVVMLTTGILGWIILGTMYGLYLYFVSFAYCFIRCRQRRREKTNAVVIGDSIQMTSQEEMNRGSNNVPVPNSQTFRNRPEKFGTIQYRIMCLTWIWFAVFIVLFMAIMFAAWSVMDYKIWERKTATSITEFQPQNIAKGIAAIYAYPKMANDLKINIFFKWATSYCGDLYTQTLSNSEKKEAIFDAFISKYDIDMSLYVKSNYLDYDSVNEWFIRHIRPEVRPIAYPTDDTILVSPADARIIAFENVPPDQEIWIKGEGFNLPELIGSHPGVDPQQWAHGSLLMVRLAPQDYHRFHTPVTGNLTAQYYISGSLHSVNADAMTSENEAVYNQRTTTIISTADFGDVAYVAIGAVCVGSVVMTANVGANVTKGDEMGYFQFGGSTLAIVFQHNGGLPRVKFSQDIMSHSKRAVESLVEMGMRVGEAA